MFKADCHCHTKLSDGYYEPMQLLEMAHQNGVSGLAITDHDSVACYDKDLFLQAKQLGIKLISGIEISTVVNKNSIHILGFGFDLDNPDLKKFCQAQLVARNKRNKLILAKLQDLNINICEEELTMRFAYAQLGRPHIAQYMVEKGIVKNMNAAFEKYLGNKARCNVPGFTATPQDAIDIIHQAGGLAVLAHPHFIKNNNVVKKLLEHNFDGIEVFYSTFHASQEQKWLDLANQKHWLTSGGSDFHGEPEYHNPIGCSYTPSEVFDKYYNCFVNNNPNFISD